MIIGSMYLYLYRVAKCLPCKGSAKARILAEIRRNILSDQEENGKLDYSGLCARFGSPEHIAASCVDDMETSEILKKLNIKRRILAAVLAVAVFIVAGFSLTMAWIIRYNANAANGYFEIETYGYEVEIIDHRFGG